MWAEADAEADLWTKLQRVSNICTVLFYKSNMQREKKIYARNLQMLVEQQSSTICTRKIICHQIKEQHRGTVTVKTTEVM